MAADLARVHGLSRTATELKLNYCQLRHRVSEVGWIGRPEPTPQFVELAALMPSFLQVPAHPQRAVICRTLRLPDHAATAKKPGSFC